MKNQNSRMVEALMDRGPVANIRLKLIYQLLRGIAWSSVAPPEPGFLSETSQGRGSHPMGHGHGHGSGEQSGRRASHLCCDSHLKLFGRILLIHLFIFAVLS